jgi:hypothetical protein
MYRLIAIDLDDTLFDTGAPTPRENVEALRRIDAAGVHVVLCSGRPTPNMVRVATGLFDADRIHYVISYNGAIVREVEREVEISRQGVELDVAREIVAYARDHDLLAQYYHDDEFFVEYADPRADEYTAKSGLPHRVVGRLEEFMDEPSPKLLMQGPAEDMPRHLSTLRKRAAGRWHATLSKPVYLEVLNPAVDKGRAMVALAGSLGVSREEIVAVGDSINDMEMLADAAVGVAVANAREEVRAAADLVTDRSARDGAVAEVIEKLFG